MKGLVAEIKGKYAVILTQDGLFKKVRALPGMSAGMETELGNVPVDGSSRRLAMKVASVAAAGLLVLGVGFGAYSYTVPYSYIDLDINPSIELTVNIYDRIIGAEALNEDGGRLLLDRELKHKKLDNGVKELLNSAIEHGYLKTPAKDTDTGVEPSDGVSPDGGDQPSGAKDPSAVGTEGEDGLGDQGDMEYSGKEPVIENAVMFTVSSNNSKKSSELKKRVTSATSKELAKDKVNSEILAGEASNEQREAARKLGVTPGKLVLIENALKYLPEKELDDVKNTAVKELIKIARKNSKEIDENKGKADKKGGNNSKSNENGNNDKSGNNSNKGNSANISRNNSNSNTNTNTNTNSEKAGYTENNLNANKGEKTAGNGDNAVKWQNSKTENSKYIIDKNDKNSNDIGNKGDNKDKNKDSSIGNDGSNSKDSNKGDNKGNNKGNNKGTNGSAGDWDQSKKKSDANLKEALEQSAEKLEKERERLRDEFLRQIENSDKLESGKDSGSQDQDKYDDDDKDRKNNNGKNTNKGPGSKKKNNSGSGGRSKNGPRK